MGQYWKIVNIDKRAEVENDGGNKMQGFLYGNVAEQLIDLISVQELPPFKTRTEGLEKAKSNNKSSRMVSLPQELIDELAYYISRRVADVAALAMTCSYFFRLLAPRWQRAIAKDHAPWAGDRLIFIGDYAEGVPDCIDAKEHESIMDDVLWDAAMDDSELEDLESMDPGHPLAFAKRNPLYEMSRIEVSGKGEIPNKRKRPSSRQQASEGRIFPLVYATHQYALEHNMEKIRLADATTGDLELYRRLKKFARGSTKPCWCRRPLLQMHAGSPP